jgi:catechol-2,3-dioxygenase
MPDGARINSVVIYVRNLDHSVTFYRELLRLDNIDSSTTAALLGGPTGCYVVLRATGPDNPRPLGAVGVQYVTWMLPSRAELDRAEQFLKDRDVHRETRTAEGITSVEGHDPDGLAVLLLHAAGGQAEMRHLPSRIYAW